MSKYFISTFLFLCAPVVFAQGLVGVPVNSGIAEFIGGLYNFALGISGIIAVLMIVVGSLYYVTSGAIDKKREGKEIITSAIWGIVLLFGAYLVLQTINPELTSLRDPSLPELPDISIREEPAACSNGSVRCDARFIISTSTTETVPVANCAGAQDCSETIRTRSVTVTPGSEVLANLFYPALAETPTVECLAYGVKESSSTSWTYFTDTQGLGACGF